MRKQLSHFLIEGGAVIINRSFWLLDGFKAGAEAVAQAGLAKQTALGYPNDGVFSGLGHGVGLGWDAPWLAAGDKTIIEPGMVLCIERTIRKNGYLGDFEETVVVTEDGCEKITDAQLRYW